MLQNICILGLCVLWCRLVSSRLLLWVFIGPSSFFLPPFFFSFLLSSYYLHRHAGKLLDFSCSRSHRVRLSSPHTKGHRDCGSELTLSVLLSGPGTEHTGGDFVTYHQGVPVVHSLQKGDAVSLCMTGGSRSSLSHHRFTVIHR